MYEKEIGAENTRASREFKERSFRLHRVFAEEIQGVKIGARKFKFDWEGGLSEIREKFTLLSCNIKLWSGDSVFRKFVEDIMLNNEQRFRESKDVEILFL